MVRAATEINLKSAPTVPFPSRYTGGATIHQGIAASQVKGFCQGVLQANGVMLFRAAELELSSRPGSADPSSTTGRDEVMLYQVDSPLVAVRVRPRPDQLTIITIPSGVTISVRDKADDTGLVQTTVDGELVAVFECDLKNHTVAIASTV